MRPVKYNAANQIEADMDSGILTYSNGLPLTENGAICISSDTPVTVQNGLPYNASGKLCVGDGTTPAPVFSQNFVGATALNPLITLTRPGSSAYIEDGILKFAAPNEPVFEDGAWRLRPQETNLLLGSQGYFSNPSYWMGVGSGPITVSPNTTIAPDLTLTADTITAGNAVYGGVLRSLLGATYLANTTYTMSVFVKAGTYHRVGLRPSGGAFEATGGNKYAWFDLTTGAFTNVVAGVGEITKGTAIQLANGWWWLSVTYRTGASAPTNVTDIAMVSSTGQTQYTPAGTETVHVWGAQVNTGDPIPYIPTTSSQVTRPADNASIQGADFAGVWNPQEGAILLDFVASNTTDNRGFLQLFQGAALNGTIRLYVNTITNTPYAPASFGVKYLGPLVPEGSIIGFTWQAGGALESWHNAVKKGSTPGWPTDVGSMLLPGSAVPILLRRLRIFRQRPSDAQMEALTS